MRISSGSMLWVAYWIIGPIGRIEPPRTWSGIWLNGALAVVVVPPAVVDPVQKSYQVPAGR